MEKNIFSGINKTDIIRRIPIFANLEKRELELISEKSRIAEYKKDETLYLEKSPPDAFYCIVGGRVKAHTSSPDGREHILEVLHRGEYFGIISLLTGDPHSLTATAINDSVILKINKEDFDILLKKIPQLAIHLSQTLSKRIKLSQAHPKTVFESNIISVYSTSKGAGRTTYAVNLSISLRRETGKKVILLDMGSSHKETSRLLGVNPINKALSLKDASADLDYIKRHTLRHYSGIEVLNILHVSKEGKDERYIIPFLGLLTNEYHFIVVDLSFQMDETVFRVLTQADDIHLITDPQKPHLEAASRLIEELNKSISDARSKIKVIINKARPDEALSGEQRKEILNNSVFANLPEMGTPGEEERLEAGPIIIREPRAEYSRAIRRISRDTGNVLVGLALGSGAALGLAQVGMIKVFESENIPIDYVVGSSIGALIGAFWASGKSARELEDVALSFENKLVTLKLVDPALPRSGLINGDEVVGFLKRNLGDKTFSDVKIPFKVVASDIYNRQIVVLEKGSLVDAVRASVSIPGIFVPVRRGNSILIDGGILDPVPVDILVNMGIRRIIAADTLPSPDDIQRTRLHEEEREKKLKAERSFLKRAKFFFNYAAKRLITPNIFDIIVNSVQAMEYSLSEACLEQADVVLKPRIIDIKWYELFNAGRLVKLGEQEALQKLPQIKKLVSE